MKFARDIKKIMDAAKALYLIHYILIAMILFDIALRFDLTQSSKYYALSGALLAPLGRLAIEKIIDNKKKK